MYRLQIDHVRDRRVANSVQLAELELMGAAEDDLSPMPVFTDVITAQGDNPPAESVAKIFDGRVETKWLDRPADRVTCASWIQWQYASPAGVLLTNVSQLLALRVRAADGYRVQIEGVVAGQQGDEWQVTSDKTNNLAAGLVTRHASRVTSSVGSLYVMDTTGCIELHDVPDAEQFKTGQRVVLAGSSEWKHDQVDIGELHIGVRDKNPPETPEHISLEQPMTPGEDLKWVEVEGEIQFGCIELHDVLDAEQFKTGQRVVLAGSSEWKHDQVDIGELHIGVRNKNPPETPEHISLEQPMTPGEDLKWVEAEGEIQFGGNSEKECTFDLQDGNRTMRVRLQRSGSAREIMPGESPETAATTISRAKWQVTGDKTNNTATGLVTRHSSLVTSNASLPPSGTRVSVRGICHGAFN